MLPLPFVRLFASLLLTFVAVAQETTAPLRRAGAYEGAASCIRCHEDQQKKLMRGGHRAILHEAALPGCETCHGPGAEHSKGDGSDIASITLPAKLAASAQEQLCARCHKDQIAAHGGDMAGLRQAGQTCTDCHEVHLGKARGAERAPFRARADAVATSDTIGSARCVECHPIRDEKLQQSSHHELAMHTRADGCELCHGDGKLHSASNGKAGLITRPDRAADGVATCRSCHEKVDGKEFHWRGKRAPYLADGLVCASCHRIHVAKQAPTAPRANSATTANVQLAATNRLCASCHVPALCTMPGSTHQLLGAPDTPLADGCDSCHRGGRAHAESGGRRQLVQRLGGAPAEQQAAVCLQCHRDDRKLQRAAHGDHQRHGVGCADCHGPLHGAEPATVIASAESQCKRCHPAVEAEFELANHHPVREGKMQCSSCHDVHGDRHRARDLDVAERRCLECHPQQRGPFVFAHQAGRREGCIACHVAHGSSNRLMLQQPTSQQNCLSCHGDFPAFHDQTTGAVFTDCMRCHTEIHGSNHSRLLFR